jgi:hypothetical protein
VVAGELHSVSVELGQILGDKGFIATLNGHCACTSEHEKAKTTENSFFINNNPG